MFIINTYQLIKQRIQTNVPQIKDFGWYMQQGTSNYKGGIVANASCFIEFGAIDTTSKGSKQQIATVPFTLYLITDNLKDSPDRMLEDLNFKHLSIVSEVYEALSGYTPLLSELSEFAALANTPDDYKVFAAPVRNTIITDHSNRSIITTKQLFTTTCTDKSATKTYTTVNRPSVIEEVFLLK